MDTNNETLNIEPEDIVVNKEPIEDNSNKLFVTYDTNTRKVLRIDNTKMEVSESTDIVELEGNIYSDDVFDLLMCRYVDGEFVIDEEIAEEIRLDKLRMKRDPLLKAFDIYKSNIMYGTVVETDEQKAIVKEWYQKILDLDEEAIDNPPSVVAKYL